MRTKPRILVVDDDPMIRRLVPVRLKSLDVEVICVAGAEEGLVAACDRAPELILLDVSMPGMDGFTFCQQLRDHATTRDVPIIFLTGADQKEEKARGFELGAVDYITKPFDPNELKARVKSALRMQALLDALENQALTDSLTGLPNRAAFVRHLARSVDRLGQSSDRNQPFALLFIDLDRFKLINDSLGHDYGDRLLIAVADTITRTLGDLDPDQSGPRPFVARMGGDEFTVLLPNHRDPSRVHDIAEAIRVRLSQPVELQDHRVTVGASIGIRLCDQADVSANELLRDSDTAMYSAKSEGKGRCMVFDEQMHQQAVERLELEQDLRDAVRSGQLQMVYQPIVDLQNRTICAVEALVRWHHPTRGVVSPAQFIPIAEETGVIIDIGTWVMEHTCEQLAQWRAVSDSLRDIRLSVNVSKVQVIVPGFVESTLRIIEQAGLKPQDVYLEVTESVIMHDGATVVPVLEQLRELGIEIAMDDFGTGYSSLSSLHRFPISLLKIDRSFVAAMTESRAHAAVVNAIVTLADNLSMKVIAEGIEEAEHLVLLQAVECAFGQGFLFGQPMPANEVAGYVERGLGLPVCQVH